MRDTFAGSSQGVSRMFDELTNQDDGIEGPKGEKRSPRGSEEKVAGDVATKWGETDDMELFFDGP
jgi:[histone H3]-trimethyl-L-lysine4 demethylase